MNDSIPNRNSSTALWQLQFPIVRLFPAITQHAINTYFGANPKSHLYIWHTWIAATGSVIHALSVVWDPEVVC